MPVKVCAFKLIHLVFSGDIGSFLISLMTSFWRFFIGDMVGKKNVRGIDPSPLEDRFAKK